MDDCLRFCLLVIDSVHSHCESLKFIVRSSLVMFWLGVLSSMIKSSSGQSELKVFHEVHFLDEGQCRMYTALDPTMTRSFFRSLG